MTSLGVGQIERSKHSDRRAGESLGSWKWQIGD